ncbi:MAG: M23 family metallopeptidase [Hyphomonadaceae bacterium]|nr:M23 family metallopeptidase [Hyphomonadaceae bacterium]
MRYLAIAATAALAAGCASTSAPYGAPGSYRQPPPPPVPNEYSTAPQASLHSELFACNGGGGSNLGELGRRAEVLGYTPYMFTPAGALLRNPTQAACLSSGYGWRGTATGGGRQHNGLDLANRGGGYIYAAGDGWISVVEWRGGYGLVVEIDHGRGVRTLYAHLSEADPNLVTGRRVQTGAPIGRMGMTGNATGVHLHYEVTVDGVQVDPLNYGVEPPPVS